MVHLLTIPFKIHSILPTWHFGNNVYAKVMCFIAKHILSFLPGLTWGKFMHYLLDPMNN